MKPAIAQLNHLGTDTVILAELERDMSKFPKGTDPFSAYGFDAGPNHALFISGWGPDRKDEATLYMNYLQDGTLCCHGVLVAKGGFTKRRLIGQ